jgi:hypothetical protein
MKTMGKYCKAYPVARLRQFSGWQENLLNLRNEKKEVDGKQVEVSRELTDDDHLYLQENLVVTDGIFLDENIIFDKVNEEWEQYCREVLKFEVPVYEPLAAQSGQP